MMTTRIQTIKGLEILDSRGLPTLQVTVILENGMAASAAIPSGASTGRFEAVELRDKNDRRYAGKGMRGAIKHIHHIIAPALKGADPFQQTQIDQQLIELDGTPNKAKLGANTLLGVSQAVARIAAKAQGLPLYAYLGGADAARLPMPQINIINGGKHADNNVDFQEFMIVPIGAPTFSECLRYSVETFQALKQLLKSKGHTTNVGDEGGFAPQLQSNEQACELIVTAIERAHYRPGIDIALALDPAASSFYESETQQYHLAKSAQGYKTSAEMNALYEELINQYPIVSLEDGLAEDDWAGFQAQTAQLGKHIQIVGDDILVTNTKFIQRAIEEKTCNAALIKLNQIGTVTETINAIQLCRAAGWRYIISHRSGETTDTFIADFAVAMGGGQIKTGSVCRGERIAKYNRLLAIETQLGKAAQFHHPFHL